MTDLFYWLLNMSIVASLVGCVVVLMRLWPRLPRRAVVLLWVLPFLRMWLPVGIGSDFSLLGLLRRLIGPGMLRIVSVEEVPEIAGSITMINSIQWASDYAPLRFQEPVYLQILQVGAAVWAVVAAALLLTMAALYGLTLWELRDAKQQTGGVYTSEKVLSPAVYGIFRPRIVLPADFAGQQLPYVLLHEQTHLRRGDNLWRMLGFVTAALHWFNPLSWIFLKKFLEDLELACDEGVLTRCDEAQRKEYAQALLSCAAGSTVCASAFGGARIRVRLQRILSYRKLTALSALTFGMFLAVLSLTLLTNAG